MRVPFNKLRVFLTALFGGLAVLFATFYVVFSEHPGDNALILFAFIYFALMFAFVLAALITAPVTPSTALGILISYPLFFVIPVFVLPFIDTFLTRLQTDRDVAIAQREDWTAHTLKTPSVPITRLIIDRGGCKEDCLARLLHASDLQLTGSVAATHDGRPNRIAQFTWQTECRQLEPGKNGFTNAQETIIRWNEWTSKNLGPGICMDLVPAEDIIPFTLISSRYPRSNLSRAARAGGLRGMSLAVTEFTRAHPEGRLLGRWEYGYYPNEVAGNYEAGTRNIVRWKATGPHGSPFTLQDMVRALLGPDYEIQPD